MQAPAAVLDFFQGPPGGKLKSAATAQLLLALISTIWAPDVSGSLAVLGILAVVMSNHDLLKLYFYLTPASLLVDVLRLAVLTRPTGYSILVMVQLLEMLAKVAGIYFAFDLYNLSAGVDGSSMNYQSFTAAPPSRSDPFYEPPSAAPDMFQQPVHSSAAGL